MMPSMNFKKKGVIHSPIKVFQVNDSTILAVYKGTLSPLDILIKYRFKQKNRKWSNIRTPKHIHWTVDILMKMQTYEDLTRDFVDFFISVWNSTVPFKTEEERQALDLEALLNLNQTEIEKFKALSVVNHK